MTDTQLAILHKLKSTLPAQWFGDSSPNIDSLLLGGPVYGLDSAHSLIQDVLPLMRIGTATGGILDLMAGDFFGNGLPRLFGEPDNSYRSRILSILFRKAATKQAMLDAIGYYTGVYPTIVEYSQPIDPIGFVVTRGDDTITGYGTVVKPHHAFITVYQMIAPQHPGVAGYGSPIGGYGVGRVEYIPPASVDYQYLFQLINAIKPIGTKIWVKVINADVDILLTTYGVTLAYPIITGTSGETLTDTESTDLMYNP